MVPELVMKGWDGLNLANSKELIIGTVNSINFDQIPDGSYWQFVAHGQGATKAKKPCLTRLQLADREVSIDYGSDWKTFSVLLKPGQRLIKNIKLVWGRSFPLKEHSNFPGCNSVKIQLVGFIVETGDKKEPFKLLLNLFGRNFYLSWKQKSCFVMFSLWLNDWVNEGCVPTVIAWEVRFVWNPCIVLQPLCSFFAIYIV